MKKKRLLIIGNAPLNDDISEDVKSFDFIVRINRMSNYDNCASHTDLWLCDMWWGAVKAYIKESKTNNDKFKDVSQIISFYKTYVDKYQECGIPDELISSTKMVSFENEFDIKNYIPLYNWKDYRPSNSLWIILYCLEKYANEYDIYITGINIFDRSYLSNNTPHVKIYKFEVELLQKLFNEGKINIMSKYKSCLAIIPAKEHSERLPNKNILPINNKELWLHSVQYAIDEGVDYIVSTDSNYIIDQCIKLNIPYYRETVDDSNIFNCIKQVVQQYPNYKNICLLQPTSPLRQPGMLRSMLNMYIESSCYTSAHIKLIGHLFNKFYIAYRAQDTNNYFEHFDGNILVINKDFLIKENKLFNDKSSFIINKIPYTLQIDTKEEYNLIKTYMENAL